MTRLLGNHTFLETYGNPLKNPSSDMKSENRPRRSRQPNCQCMMELMVASPIRRERISHVTEWPKVPQTTVDITVEIQTPKSKEGKFIATSDKEFETIGEARKSVQSVEWPKVPQTIIAERNIEVQLSNSNREEKTAALRPTVEEVLGSVTGSHVEVQSSGSSREENVAPPIPSVEVILGSGTGRCAPNPGQESTQQLDSAPGRVAPTDEVNSIETEVRHTVKLPASPPTIYSDSSQVAKENETIDCATSTKPATTSKSTTPNTPIAESSKSQKLGQRSTTLSRLGLVKNQWPEPHLSIGAKCNRLGGNECWKAIGPAEELFAHISKPIEDLLDARVDDLEEGEPVAGHILLFDLYMIGKSAATAQPTLLFTCRRPKPRKRAIKFVKESGLLRPHPKIALAESAVPPLVMGRGYVRLLGRHTTHQSQGRSSYPLPLLASLVDSRETATPAASSNVPVGAIVGCTIGGVILIVLLVAAFLILRRLNKAIKVTELANSRTLSSGPRSGRSPQRPSPNQEIDTLSVDPLFMSPFYTSGANSVVHEMETNSPPVSISPFSPGTPPYTHYPKSYNPISSSDSRYSQSSRGYRHPSVEPSLPLQHNPNAGYFDLSPQSAGHRGSDQMTEIQNPTSSKALMIRMSAPSTGPSDGNKPTDGREISVRFFGRNLESILRRNDLYGYYGIPIIGSSTNMLSTIGGILHSNGVFYGLTVSHIFGNPTQLLSFSVPSPDQQGDDSEFAFDEDDEEVQEIDMTDVAITSQGKLPISCNL